MDIKYIFDSVRNGENPIDNIAELIRKKQLYLLDNYEECVSDHEYSNLIEFALCYLNYDVINSIICILPSIKHNTKLKKFIKCKLLLNLRYLSDDLNRYMLMIDLSKLTEYEKNMIDNLTYYISYINYLLNNI